MKIAYFDCFAGASGDMVLGALIDTGLPLDALTVELRKLPLTGYQLSAQQAKRGVVTGTQVTVTINKYKGPQRRSLEEILNLIAASTLPDRVKEQGAAIFQRLAAAEARVHRVPPKGVHFHELGAIDAIVDILGAVIGLNLLGIEAVFSSPLPTGGGMVKAAHGTLPVPAPATLELLAMAKAPIRASADYPQEELVTPTGAAIITTLASFERPQLSLERIGYGVGTRQFPTLPNVLRLWLGEGVAPGEAGNLVLLETNIDNMNPELYGYVLERLFERGAADVWFTPIQMKKNRPGVMLSVLAPIEAEGKIIKTILGETSTLGVRVQPVERHLSEREVLEFESSLGPVAVKLKRLHGTSFSIAPEFESCRRLALEHSLPLQEVYRIVAQEAHARYWPKE